MLHYLFCLITFRKRMLVFWSERLFFILRWRGTEKRWQVSSTSTPADSTKSPGSSHVRPSKSPPSVDIKYHELIKTT